MCKVSTLSLRKLLGPLLYADILVLVFGEGEWREVEEDMSWLFFLESEGTSTGICINVLVSLCACVL